MKSLIKKTSKMILMLGFKSSGKKCNIKILDGISLIGLTPSHFCACPKPGSGFPKNVQ